MLIREAMIFPVDAPVIQRGFVRVREGRIDAVGPMERAPQSQPGEALYDLPGRRVYPGFVDAHCHVGIEEDSIGRAGEDCNEIGDPLTPQVRALDGINPFDRCFAEARAAGVTSVVVAPGSANPIGGQICAIKTAGRWVDRMAVRAPLAMKFAFGENPKRVYGTKDKTPSTRMGTAGLIRDQLSQARRYAQDLERAEREGSAPPAWNAKCEALLPLLRGEMRAHFHAHRAYDLLTAVRIAEEFGLDYTLVHCTEGHLIADILAELGARVICGPVISTRSKPELSGLTFENCASLGEAGVPVAICTDHPVVPLDLLALSASLCAAHGMAAEDALSAITLQAARAAGIEDRVGSITPGKDADLVVFADDPLLVNARPELVLIDGAPAGGDSASGSL